MTAAYETMRLIAVNHQLIAALEPFARNVDAGSLDEAIGHITREHLLAARAAVAKAKGSTSRD